MHKINWVQKLTSRKFISSIIGFVTTILVILNISDVTIEHVISIISSASIIVAYILGETSIDCERMKLEYLEKIDDMTKDEVYLENIVYCDTCNNVKDDGCTCDDLKG